MSMQVVMELGAMVLAVFVAAGHGSSAMAGEPEPSRGRAVAADGVEIAYTAAGTGEIALVFIHGGLADRGFWAPQLDALGGEFRVVALDLGGHGESGGDREAWTIASFAGDVRAVVEVLDLTRVVLVGNSLGGPVALEAARAMPDRVIGVIGVDTFHHAGRTIGVADSKARAEGLRRDFPGACHAMAEALFHPGAYPELRARVERVMRATTPEVAADMVERFGGYDLGAAFRGAGVPIRAINGDLWPTLVEANRALAPDFAAVIMADAGHYPMLERPEEFNRHLVEVVAGIVERE